MTEDSRDAELNAEIKRELLRELRRVLLIETFDPFADLYKIPVEPSARPAFHHLIDLPASALPAFPFTITLEQARNETLAKFHDYANNDKSIPALLVKPMAGLGKTRSAIEFVQERAAMGERWLWAAQNHAMFEDLSRHPNFKRELWYHWQPMDGEIDGAPACRYAEAQRTWAAKGYKARALCWQLCGDKKGADQEETRYMDKCPFRCQGEKEMPITFIMHQHLFTGLDNGRVDGIVIDESFVPLLARERYIPGEQIKQASVNLKIIEFADLLYNTWTEIHGHWRAGGRCSGAELLKIIGDVYPDAVTQLDLMRQAEELKAANKSYRNPRITQPEDVNGLQTIYMDDLAQALAPEYKAYMGGRTTWAERVWLDRDGLHFVTAAPLWDSLPKHVVALDATGERGFYQSIFLRKVEEYYPSMLRKGRVFQVTGKMYNKGRSTTRKASKDKGPNGQKKYDIEAAKDTQELIRNVKGIIKKYKYDLDKIGVICNLAVVKFIREGLGLEENQVMHFYALRGRNDFQDCKALFVLGTPTPPERTITNIALALDPRRIDPIYQIDEDGQRVPIYKPVEVEYRLSQAGVEHLQKRAGPEFSAVARVIGCYPDPLLSSIQNQLREAELLQAVYRARLLTNPADVWIFSSIPIQGIEVDAVYDTPPIQNENHPGIPWRFWQKLCDWFEQSPVGSEFGYAEIAQGVDAREDYVRSLRALDALADEYGDEIEIERVRKITESGKGRPPRTLTKL